MSKSTRNQKIRVAAAQFAVGVDIEQNLQTCLHWIKEAAACKPDLLVLPEFANHASWYDDEAHCERVSVDLEGDFLQQIAAAVRELGAYLVINVTLRRGDGVCSGTSVLFSPAGDVLATNDKQVLIGHENQFLRRAVEPGPIVDTDIGKLGLYACMDGVVSETPRGLALRGAQILCNSLNSFATDEGSLHIPVRAAENRIFVVAANKIGPLIPEVLLEPVSQQTGIPVKFLSGAGDSQIVSPNGTVLAMASPDKAELIWADIDLADLDDTLRPDGTDLIKSRRPDLYAPVAQDPETQPEPAFSGAAALKVAAIQLPGVGDGALDAACERVQEAAKGGARYIALPELFFLKSQQVADVQSDIAKSQEAVAAIQAVCGDACVAMSIVENDEATQPQLKAVLINKSGIVLRQGQLHASQRHEWSSQCAAVNSYQFEDAHVAVLCGDDALYPELGRLQAMKGVDLLLVCAQPLEPWEMKTGLVERAAENRMNLVAACQPGLNGSSLIASLQRDFTVMTPWEERPFDGLLSQPELTRAAAEPGVTSATVYPAAAANKVVSLGTDLVRGRAWWLAGPLAGLSADSLK